MNIGLSDDVRKQVALKLSKILANQYTLQVKAQNFHWNVVSSDFGPLHALFQSNYDLLSDNVDAVAERIRSLGHFSLGSMTEFKQHATIQEDEGIARKDVEMLKKLLSGHEEIICQKRLIINELQKLGDEGTANFLTDIMEKHEKIAWMIRSHIV